MITLKTLKDATSQQVYSQVRQHMLKQMAKSERPATTGNHKFCAYRGDKGLACAAGCLIGDDEYNEALEGYTWAENVDNGTLYVVSGVDVTNCHSKLIGELQEIHDTCAVEHWEAHLNILARNWGLSPE